VFGRFASNPNIIILVAIERAIVSKVTNVDKGIYSAQYRKGCCLTYRVNKCLD
jgi:hypothetical protein